MEIDRESKDREGHTKRVWRTEREAETGQRERENETKRERK